MKTKFFIFLMLLCGAISIGTASFPVEKTTASEITINGKKDGGNLKQVQVTAQKKEAQEMTSPAAGGSKSQLVALILVIFVGYIGIHRFYLGYTGIGIIQLLTAGGCGVWTLIDLIRIATGDLKPKNGEYDETL